MNRSMVLSIALILIVSVGLVAFAGYTFSSKKYDPPFHVGVTFGGDNSAEAKLLIDRVKDYTNLFVVASGPLQNNLTELENTCDYAVKAGLDLIVYFGSYQTQRNTTAAFIDTANQRWGSHFLGVYYGDEPSGKALDVNMRLDNVADLGNVTVSQYAVAISQTCNSTTTSKSFTYSGEFLGRIVINYADQANYNYTMVNYFPNGTIALSKNDEYLIYLPNGTVLKQTFIETNSESGADLSNETVFHHIWQSNLTPILVEVTDRGNISQFETYQQLWDSRPFQTKEELSAIATSYIKTQRAITDWIANRSDVKLFTSDYALYWWDYQIGYDTVFAELGWNNTAAQEIGLIRGAANLQNKDWGTIITWTYTQPPYLATGEDVYNQMRLSYECGAQYIILFNYAENMTNPYGTLQDEHFQALERFWNQTVKNSSVPHGGTKAEATLVLPKDYGWGMRNTNDTIWAIWKPDTVSQQIWHQLQNKISQYGPKLDIIYDDAAYPVADKYSQIFYWNQTG